MFAVCPYLSIKRNDGTTEHPVRHTTGEKAGEVIVHVSKKPCGHTSVIDPHEHPQYHPHFTPEEHAARVRHFLKNGGHKLLGYPGKLWCKHRRAEVKRLKLKHGL